MRCLNSMKWLYLLCLLGGFILFSPLLEAKGSKEEVLIITPARERMIKLAIDLAAMRKNISVVSFRLPVKTKGDPVFFLWDKGNWQPVMYDDFCEMRCLTKVPGKIIIIGDNEAIPNSVMNAMPWAEKTIRITTMIVSDIINQLDPHLTFTEKEWKKLAANHGLVLEDLNAEKRKFNPYDIPRSKLPIQIIPKTKAGRTADLPDYTTEKEEELKMPVIEETDFPVPLDNTKKMEKKNEMPPK